ncbi:diguanylate cyclase [Rhizobiales bacterium RZME27]|jgi:diguanylate cyclase (GGDEF)-like protein/PAS domain S-box-containing protein|uniref:Diguanylate cyclase n=1 Tax=Endobacterium cereale TaxID=2663029 RepID=A0A6A8A6P9_9HYPH|nr:diguanylate cyclase [Endobacterium cereale]MEB2844392.1 diguanylate cyclase [Endobacterium cereale]MQY46982.1 diguanylate cyclase [Endobacterium cereale]
MSSAMLREVVSEDHLDALDELRYQLLRISTSVELDDDQRELLRRAMDAASILDDFPEYFYIKDRHSRYVYVNAAVAAAGGFNSASDMTGTTVFDHIRLEKAEEIFMLEQQLMSSGKAIVEREEFIESLDRDPIWLQTTKTRLFNDGGQVIGLLGLSRDITGRKRQEEMRHGHAVLLEMIARGQPLPKVLEALTNLVERQLSEVCASVLLLEEGTDRLRHGAAPSLPETYVKLIDGIEIGPRTGSCGTAAWRRSRVVVSDIENDPLWHSFGDLALVFGFRACWSMPIMAPDGAVLGTVALYARSVREPSQLELELMSVATDIAGIAIERTRSEERIRHMAHHDALTGLPNRALFWTQFNRVLLEAKRESHKVTVAYIDLDNFKQINDCHGHAAGDEVLKVLAGRMAACVRSGDLLVRLGGDEFAIVFPKSFPDEPNVMRRLHEVRMALSSPILIEGKTVRPSCSMGAAFYPQDGDSAESLLASADRAMYDAKQLGRDRLSVTQPVLADGSGI